MQAAPYSSYYLDISDDGRFVTFMSDATTLAPGDSNGRSDVFVRDRDTDGDGTFDESGSVATSMVSVSTDGTQGNDGSGAPWMSADGRYVVFGSSSSNLDATDGNGRSDVFLRDRDRDQDGIFDEVASGAVETRLASPAPGGGQLTTHVAAFDISADGHGHGFEAPQFPSGATDMLLYATDVSTGASQLVRNVDRISTIRQLTMSADGSTIVTNACRRSSPSTARADPCSR